MATGTWNLAFQVKNCPTTPAVGVVGSLEQLGNWDVKKCLKLTADSEQIWKGAISFPSKPARFEFKYALLRDETGTLEPGPPRFLEVSAENYIQTDEFGVHPEPTPLVGHIKPPAAVAAVEANLVASSDKARSKKKKKLSDAELQQLQEQIRVQKERLRQLHDADPNKSAPLSSKPELMREASVMLELKHLGDPAFIATQKRKTLKIRWELVDVRTQARRRLQFPFPDRVAVTGEEIRAAVTAVTTRHHPAVGRCVRARLVDNNGSKREIADSEKVRLPLQFPGPVFRDAHVYLFECDFEHPDAVQIPVERFYFKLHTENN